MVRGQILDILAETAAKPLTLSELEDLQDSKTGALIQASCVAGALLGNATDKDIQAVSRFGRLLARAFQIAVDILDVQGDEQRTGRSLRMDPNAGKSTFVSQLGLDEANRQAHALIAEAIDELSRYGANFIGLRDIARFVVAREY